MANALSLPYKSLHLYGSPQGPTQPRSAVRSYCPFDSPWDNDAANTGRMDDMSVSMNLDDFIPLDELLDASLHSLDSACSDRTTFQVAKTPLQSVGSSISSFYPPRLARAAVTAVSLPSVKDDSKESSVKEPPTMSGEAPAAAAAPRRSRKRKLLLPANTRKINREAQQRFRLKQKQRQQEISDEIDKLRAENRSLSLKVKQLDEELQAQLAQHCKVQESG